MHIVHLDGIHAPPPTFSQSFQYTYKSHDSTPPDDSVIISRLKDTDVVITTRIPITEATLSVCPRLKLVAVMAIGTDMIDLAACKKHRVTVSNVPAASNESVCEHAIALYFALRRNVVRMHDLTSMGSLWRQKMTLKSEFGECPRTCRQEIAGIFGGGELGNRVANMARALGMKAQFADRKGASTVREGRVAFEECLKTSTVLFLTLPLSAETLNMISTPEFKLMRSDVLIVNVARGGIINEEALVQAIKDREIGAAATDVYVEEPAGLENNVLVRAANDWAEGERKGGILAELNGRLVLTPHIAWFASSSLDKLRRTVASNIEAWARGEATNIVL